MTYDLYIGDRTFSSWSLRGWLMLEKFGLPFNTHLVALFDGSLAKNLDHLALARLVPVLRTPEGQVIGETMAIAETLAERHPDAGLWPSDAGARAHARWICAEMAAGFSALRSTFAMQLEHVCVEFDVPDTVRADLDRIEQLWASARAMRTTDGPWLFGDYSLADAFYAPVAARMVGYDLPVSRAARDYCALTVNDPAFKAWRAEGLKVSYDRFPYDIGGTTRPWPVAS
ncbi:MAG: glutathione S-transferase [Sulfitobacter sp.]